jgi:hypothetical protein
MPWPCSRSPPHSTHPVAHTWAEVKRRSTPSSAKVQGSAAQEWGRYRNAPRSAKCLLQARVGDEPRPPSEREPHHCATGANRPIREAGRSPDRPGWRPAREPPCPIPPPCAAAARGRPDAWSRSAGASGEPIRPPPLRRAGSPPAESAAGGVHRQQPSDSPQVEDASGMRNRIHGNSTSRLSIGQSSGKILREKMIQVASHSWHGGRLSLVAKLGQQEASTKRRRLVPGFPGIRAIRSKLQHFGRGQTISHVILRHSFGQCSPRIKGDPGSTTFGEMPLAGLGWRPTQATQRAGLKEPVGQVLPSSRADYLTRFD